MRPTGCGRPKSYCLSSDSAPAELFEISTRDQDTLPPSQFRLNNISLLRGIETGRLPTMRAPFVCSANILVPPDRRRSMHPMCQARAEQQAPIDGSDLRPMVVAGTQMTISRKETNLPQVSGPA